MTLAAGYGGRQEVLDAIRALLLRVGVGGEQLRAADAELAFRPRRQRGPVRCRWRGWFSGGRWG